MLILEMRFYWMQNYHELIEGIGIAGCHSPNFFRYKVHVFDHALTFQKYYFVVKSSSYLPFNIFTKPRDLTIGKCQKKQ